MALPRVNQSCCGCSLETGSKIIAWLQIIFGVVLALGGIIAMAGGGNQQRGHETSGSIYVGQVIGGIFSVIIGAVLLVGIKNQRPSYLNLWVTLNLIGMVLYIIMALIQAVLIIIAGQIGVGIGVLFVGLLQSAITFYLIVVVSSYRKDVAGRTVGV